MPTGAGMKLGVAVSLGRLELGVQRGVEPGILGTGGQRAARGAEELNAELEGLGPWRATGSAEQDVAPLRPARGARNQGVLGLGGQWRAWSPSCGARTEDAELGVLGLGGRRDPGALGCGVTQGLARTAPERSAARKRGRGPGAPCG